MDKWRLWLAQAFTQTVLGMEAKAASLHLFSVTAASVSQPPSRKQTPRADPRMSPANPPRMRTRKNGLAPRWSGCPASRLCGCPGCAGARRRSPDVPALLRSSRRISRSPINKKRSTGLTPWRAAD
uniref:Putative secreted protein n=1 Tax=Ixodes ricinus TaxID=34613 RepID=A0A147BMX1_IXORI